MKSSFTSLLLPVCIAMATLHAAAAGTCSCCRYEENICACWKCGWGHTPTQVLEGGRWQMEQGLWQRMDRFHPTTATFGDGVTVHTAGGNTETTLKDSFDLIGWVEPAPTTARFADGETVNDITTGGHTETLALKSDGSLPTWKPTTDTHIADPSPIAGGSLGDTAMTTFIADPVEYNTIASSVGGSDALVGFGSFVDGDLKVVSSDKGKATKKKLQNKEDGFIRKEGTSTGNAAKAAKKAAKAAKKKLKKAAKKRLRGAAA